MSQEREMRGLEFESVEIREEDGRMTLRGVAAPFNSLSEPIFGMFRERIRPGAFRRSLASDADIFALWQHDSSMPLSRRSLGTLRLRETDAGLAVEMDIPDTSYGRDAAEAVRSGLVDRMSFGFSVPRGGDEMTGERSDDGFPIRELTDVDLHEVSPVTFPAYEATTISARSREAAEKLLADAEGKLETMRRRLDLQSKS